MSVPYLDPAWRLHAAGFQTSAAGAAVLGNSVNVVRIDRIGAGVYSIILDAPLDPADSLLLAAGFGLVTVVLADSAPDNDITRGVRILDLLGAGTDAIFRFVVLRYHTF